MVRAVIAISWLSLLVERRGADYLARLGCLHLRIEPCYTWQQSAPIQEKIPSTASSIAEASNTS